MQEKTRKGMGRIARNDNGYATGTRTFSSWIDGEQWQGIHTVSRRNGTDTDGLRRRVK